MSELGTIPIALANGIAEYLNNKLYDRYLLCSSREDGSIVVNFAITDQSLPTAYESAGNKVLELEQWRVEFTWNGRRWMISKACRVLKEPTDSQSTGQDGEVDDAKSVND